MKKSIVIRVVFLISIFFIFKNSLAREYKVLPDTIFTKPHNICIDPGYGEPGSSKYGVNGFSKKILENLSYYHYLLIDSN